MTVEELLLELTSRSIQVGAEGGDLKVRAPKGTLSPELRAALAERKPEILSHLSRKHAGGSEVLEFPLSYGQRTFWYYYQIMPTSPAYNIMYVARVRSDLEVDALRRAFQALVRRHATLRTTYALRDGQAVQRVHPDQDVFFEVIDAAAWDEETVDARLHQLADLPFDLERGPLFKIHLFMRRHGEHILLLTGHHIGGDFWSLNILTHEFPIFYEHERRRAFEPPPLAPLEFRFGDFVRWQADRVAGPEGEKLWSYWRGRLAGECAALELPTDRPRPPVQTFQGGANHFDLGDALTGRIRALARAEAVTPFVVVLAAFQVLLGRYSGQDDVLIGTPTVGRTRPEHEAVFGTFVNPVVLRADLSGNPTFRAFLGQARQTVLEALEHQDYPFPLLVERLQPARDPSRSPLFQVAIIWEKMRRPARRGESSPSESDRTGQGSGALQLELLKVEQRGAPLDLSLSIFEMGGSFEASLSYNVDLFDASTIGRMTTHFRTLLESMTADSELRLLDCPMVTDAERARLLVEGTGEPAEPPKEACVHEMFEAQARRTPDAVAVVSKGESLTYAALDRKANQLAHYLRARGVGPDVLVGICLPRTPDLLVGLLGILKAGGAYLPLAPEYPQDRLVYMARDAAATVLVSQSALLNRLPEPLGHVVCLDADLEAIAGEPASKPAAIGLTPDHLAYVIYTSGSTGTPKGVQIPHGAVVNFLESMRHQPGVTERDALLAVTSLSFDIAALELFLPLTVGARVVLVERDVAMDGVRLAAQLAGPDVTIMQATPATWRLLIAAGWQGGKHLKVLCGGEALTRTLADQLLARSGSVWNMYGPTETTIWSTLDRVEPGPGPVTIGRPIANTQVHVLDSRLQLVPTGVAGELYIGGDGLARGYLNQPELTARQFVSNPFSNPRSARLYKTGDVARTRPDGRFEVVGRRDHQVKIRGVRIDLGEIEAVLGQHPDVRQAVVAAWENDGAEKRLVAYIVPNGVSAPLATEARPTAHACRAAVPTHDAARHEPLGIGASPSCAPEENGFSLPDVDETRLSVDRLRKFLKETLPEAMIPSAFVTLEALPLTPAGKIDRAALPAPGPSRPDLSAPYVAPRNSVEERLAAIWSQLLGVSRVGVHDNFFALGGASLQGLQIVTEANAVGLPLTPELLFEFQTIAELAARCGAGPAPSPDVRDGSDHPQTEAAIQAYSTLRDMAL